MAWGIRCGGLMLKILSFEPYFEVKPRIFSGHLRESGGLAFGDTPSFPLQYLSPTIPKRMGGGGRCSAPDA